MDHETFVNEFAFLRQRAAQLLEEGLEAEARRMLTAIDEEQLRWIAAELEERQTTAHTRKAEH